MHIRLMPIAVGVTTYSCVVDCVSRTNCMVSFYWDLVLCSEEDGATTPSSPQTRLPKAKPL